MPETIPTWSSEKDEDSLHYEIWIALLTNKKYMQHAVRATVEVNAGRNSHVELGDLDWSAAEVEHLDWVRYAKTAYAKAEADHRRTGRTRYRLQLWSKSDKALECATLKFGDGDGLDGDATDGTVAGILKMSTLMLKDQRTYCLALHAGLITSLGQSTFAQMMAGETLNDALTFRQTLAEREDRIRTRSTPADTNYRIGVVFDTIKEPLSQFMSFISPVAAEMLKQAWRRAAAARDRRKEQWQQQRAAEDRRERGGEDHGGRARNAEPGPAQTPRDTQPAPDAPDAPDASATQPPEPTRVPDRATARKLWGTLDPDQLKGLRGILKPEAFEAIKELILTESDEQWNHDARFLPQVLGEHTQELRKLLTPAQQLLVLELL